MLRVSRSASRVTSDELACQSVNTRDSPGSNRHPPHVNRRSCLGSADQRRLAHVYSNSRSDLFLRPRPCTRRCCTIWLGPVLVVCIAVRTRAQFCARGSVCSSRVAFLRSGFTTSSDQGARRAMLLVRIFSMTACQISDRTWPAPSQSSTLLHKTHLGASYTSPATVVLC
ncbi:hypothetical protein GE09DRAFT_546583 [Coniochaeta sp. 2T2.1]|nr:hypothetical protein GE09DRAFT_546583 [Coniochaeta sp. 2T2.1]